MKHLNVERLCNAFRSRIKGEIDRKVDTLFHRYAADDPVIDTPIACVQLSAFIGERWHDDLCAIQDLCMDLPGFQAPKVYGCDGYGDMIPDVWLMVWRHSPLEGTTIHDHAISAAGIYMVKGEVTELRYDLADNEAWWAHNDPLAIRNIAKTRLYPGDTVRVQVPYIHRMIDHHIDGCSVHSYYPPLDSQSSYLHVGDSLYKGDTWAEDQKSKCALA